MAAIFVFLIGLVPMASNDKGLIAFSVPAGVLGTLLGARVGALIAPRGYRKSADSIFLGLAVALTGAFDVTGLTGGFAAWFDALVLPMFQ